MYHVILALKMTNINLLKNVKKGLPVYIFRLFCTMHPPFDFTNFQKKR
jgi:hypothetical protein